MELSVRALKMWVGEHFTQNQTVGYRGMGDTCLIANYLKVKLPHVEKLQVGLDEVKYYDENGNPRLIILDEPLRHVVSLFDKAGRWKSRVQARTALKILHQVEDEFREQVEEPEQETKTSDERVGTTPALV